MSIRQTEEVHVLARKLFHLTCVLTCHGKLSLVSNSIPHHLNFKGHTRQFAAYFLLFYVMFNEALRTGAQKGLLRALAIPFGGESWIVILSPKLVKSPSLIFPGERVGWLLDFHPESKADEIPKSHIFRGGR